MYRLLVVEAEDVDESDVDRRWWALSMIKINMVKRGLRYLTAGHRRT